MCVLTLSPYLNTYFETRSIHFDLTKRPSVRMEVLLNRNCLVRNKLVAEFKPNDSIEWTSLIISANFLLYSKLLIYPKILSLNLSRVSNELHISTWVMEYKAHIELENCDDVDQETIHGWMRELIVRLLFAPTHESRLIITEKEAGIGRRRWNAPSSEEMEEVLLDEKAKMNVEDPSRPQHQQVDVVAPMTTTTKPTAEWRWQWLVAQLTLDLCQIHRIGD